ncbi:MAG: Hsp20/alpha crystallin family protein [Rhodospirillales bacterium]|nr:Hsp20/alpha crystallin family protein [Rhodospirillales bacterium]
MNVRDLIPWSRDREVAVARRDVEHPFFGLQREVDRLFEDFWRGFNAPAQARTGAGLGAVAPRVDVAEDENEIVVTAELPGIDEKDVELTLADNALIIAGEKKAETEKSGQGYRYTERSFGSFRRAIPFEVDVVGDKVEASFKNGVLTVTLPKSPEARARARKIEIKGRDSGGEEPKLVSDAAEKSVA